MGAYQDYIATLNPDHYWALEQNSTNTGSISLTTQTPAGYVQGPAITAGSLGSGSFDGTNSLDYGDSSLNVGGPWTTRSYSIWGTFDDPNRDSLMMNAGASVRNISMYYSIGGVPAYLFSNDADSNPGQPWSQAIFGPALVQGRPYHMGMVWQSLGAGTVGGGSYMTAYLNGEVLDTQLIFQNNTNLAGGQMNAHSGNIELGLGQQIIVAGQTFNVSNHVGLIADCAVWDNVVLSDAVMRELYTRGAAPTSVDVEFQNVPAGAVIRVFELDAIGGTVQSTFGSVQGSVGGTETFSYTVAVDVPVRIVIITTDEIYFSSDTTLTRAGSTFDVDLLLRQDRSFNNPS